MNYIYAHIFSKIYIIDQEICLANPSFLKGLMLNRMKNTVSERDCPLARDKDVGGWILASNSFYVTHSATFQKRRHVVFFLRLYTKMPCFQRKLREVCLTHQRTPFSQNVSHQFFTLVAAYKTESEQKNSVHFQTIVNNNCLKGIISLD